jgi:putative membrane protein
MDLTDAEIMAVTTAANTGEIAQANAALPKLTDEDVQEFAMMMREMHMAAQMRQTDLAESKDITPAANPVSMELTMESEAIVTAIDAASEDEVDALYMGAQVMVHEKVLATIEDVLIPSADDADLVDELETSRDEVEAHLEMAREIADAL